MLHDVLLTNITATFYYFRHLADLLARMRAVTAWCTVDVLVDAVCIEMSL